jgi:hypothetical protein
MDEIHFNVMAMMLVYYSMTSKYFIIIVMWTSYCVVRATVSLSIYRIDK